MIASKGTVYSLKELAQKFMSFCTQGNGTTNEWTSITPNKVDSFYGGTVAVPMTKHTVNGKNPYYYITLQYRRITSKSYREFLDLKYNSEIYDTENIVSSAGLSGGTNPFVNNGEFLAIGLHTEFDPDLWMIEQNHITCDEETRLQKNHSNLAKNIVLYKDAPRYTPYDYVNYPGTGCPWFTLSEKNIEDYKISTYGIQYWFTKDNYSATITINIAGDHSKVARWQSMSFGMLEGIDDKSYMFPLYVAGGSQGLSADIFVTGLTGMYPAPYNGNVYDLSIDNIGLSNSYLLAPTYFNKAETSNFRVLSPEGIWRNIYAYKQEAKQEAEYVCQSITSNWFYPLQRPTVYSDGHTTTAFLSDVSGMVDTYLVKEAYDEYKSSSPVFNISVILNENIDHNETGVQGTLTQSYYTWSRTLPCGEITLNKKKWLSVPNGWKGRKKWYEYHINLQKEWKGSELLDKEEDSSSPLKDNVFSHNLLIPLEE